MEPAREFAAVAASLAHFRKVVAACAQAAGGTPAMVYDAVLAANEAATNAIVHGYDGGSADASIELRATREPGWLQLVVADKGSGFRPRRHSPGFGLGLALIAQLADELQLCEDGGIEVVMRFRTGD